MDFIIIIIIIIIIMSEWVYVCVHACVWYKYILGVRSWVCVCVCVRVCARVAPLYEWFNRPCEVLRHIRSLFTKAIQIIYCMLVISS